MNGASLVKKIHPAPITGHQDFAVQTNLGAWLGQAFETKGGKEPSSSGKGWIV